MIRGVFDYNLRKLPAEELKAFVREKSTPDDTRALMFMKSKDVNAWTSQPAHDRFTGEMIQDADNGHYYDGFAWFVSDIYHAEKYHLAFSKEFIKYVKNAEGRTAVPVFPYQV